MAEVQHSQRKRIFISVMLAILIAGFLATPVGILLGPGGHDVTNLEIQLSSMWPIFFWCVYWLFMLAQKPGSTVPWILRIFWPLGCVLLLLHIAIAFHLGHGWSHEVAWKHTQEIGGYGDGIYVNYAFALVWLADAMWLAIAPGSYLTRPRWLHWTIHGFLAFVMINAAVVFGSWWSRFTFANFAVMLWLVLPRVQRWASRKVAEKALRNAPAKSETTPVDMM
jgi:hypothetical protein